MGIEAKIFLGIRLTKEIQYHLDKNFQWQEEKILHAHRFQEMIQENKNYFGLFIPSYLSLEKVKENERLIKNQLQIYCPKLNVEGHSGYLFTQFFIS